MRSSQHRTTYPWKGGRKFHEGYWMIWKPEHPLAHKNGYIPEHRLVIMEHLGRLLKKNEVVHHKNHNKTDNRIENLIVMPRKVHQSLHNKGKKKTEEHKKKLSLIAKNSYPTRIIDAIIKERME